MTELERQLLNLLKHEPATIYAKLMNLAKEGGLDASVPELRQAARQLGACGYIKLEVTKDSDLDLMITERGWSL